MDVGNLAIFQRYFPPLFHVWPRWNLCITGLPGTRDYGAHHWYPFPRGPH